MRSKVTTNHIGERKGEEKGIENIEKKIPENVKDTKNVSIVESKNDEKQCSWWIRGVDRRDAWLLTYVAFQPRWLGVFHYY